MQIKSSLLLIIVIIGMFTLIINHIPSVISDTHIEGHITQDTVWTLTDSPFIIIRDVTIEANTTLTIEPGVEVRFGGNFSLVVEGKLIAEGTKENPITFTSNKLQPNPGDWISINFTNNQLSHLEHCIIEYAKDGITIDNGNVLITKSNITNSLQNGVYITGTNYLSISENRIESNQNGIFVTGNSSGTTIQQNNIYFNSETGIRLCTANNTHVDDIAILNNSLSTNPLGIHIYGQVDANITWNSIAYNDLGILYENATNIQPLHYNDFYGNALAAEAQLSDSVNAEYNYWGDARGPYHESLNPHGEGNPVESNGTDLDFIPFLTINNSYINQRPTANLLTDKRLVTPNDDITFVGTLSNDDRQVYRYFFNFGDGKNSSWTTLSIFKHKYNSEGTYIATLIAMDDFGAISTNTALTTINIQNITPLNVHLELGFYTVKYGGSVPITVQVTDGTNPIAAASITLISVINGTFQPASGLTDSTGRFTTTFTAPNPSRLENIRIIATASKNSYADGSDYKYLRVLPPLLVEILPDSPEIESEDTTSITVHVTYSGKPIDDAYVEMQFNIDGNISQTSGYTDNGTVTFNFTAPPTSIPTVVDIAAVASMEGYISAESETQILVVPKIFGINMTTQPQTIFSEETSTITILVTCNGNPVANANVTISSDGEDKFDFVTKYTDEEGSAIFVFTASSVTEKTNVTITATVTKLGYAVRSGIATVTVKPKNLEVTIVANPYSIESEETSNVVVYVRHNGKPIPNANISITATNGTFSQTTGLTNSNGYCTFIFTAPKTTSEISASVLANATKLGYISAQNQATIYVIPQTIAETGGGWPLTTILLIVIPIVIVMIIVVLIKLRIIEISSREEET